MNLTKLWPWSTQASASPSEISGTRSPKEWLIKLLGGDTTRAKVRVTPETSLRIAAVYRCVTILSNTVAMLPLDMYRRTSAGRKLAVDHGLYSKLKLGPNANTTAFRFRQSLQAHISMRGNGYAEVIRSSRGEVTALRQMHADRVRVRATDSGDLVYDELTRSGQTPHPERNVLHVRGFTLDGLMGLNPIELAREGFGLAIAAEAAGAEAFGHGPVPPGVLSVKGTPNKEQRGVLRESWREQHGGNRTDIAVLGENADFKPLPVNLEDMQYIEARKFQVFEIARLFGVPPHMLYELDRATYANHEAQGIDFLTHTMQPYFTAWEQELRHALLTPAEQDDFYFEFNTAALLRTDTKTRNESYKLQREMGVLSGNEVRRAENLPDRADGDTYMEPANMRIVGQPTNTESEQ